MQRQMAFQAGARLGPYEIVNALGAGGMGEVYRARDTRLDRTVAITEAIDIAMQIGTALDRAHRADIVHRDLKPGRSCFSSLLTAR
jgi:serine/threonine protein kinase